LCASGNVAIIGFYNAVQLLCKRFVFQGVPYTIEESAGKWARKSSMPPDSPKAVAKEIVACLQHAGFAAFRVGGCACGH